jgi:hypothetical protein
MGLNVGWEREHSTSNIQHTTPINREQASNSATDGGQIATRVASSLLAAPEHGKGGRLDPVRPSIFVELRCDPVASPARTIPRRFENQFLIPPKN